VLGGTHAAVGGMRGRPKSRQLRPHPFGAFACANRPAASSGHFGLD